jgi:hypothetical protein
MPLRAVLALAAVCLVLAGCGGDDEDPTTEAAPPPSATETTDAETTETEAETEPDRTEAEAEPEATGTSTSPEDQPGGAGDEEPARSIARFTAENGRITPRVIRVPAFISIRVELRSADGRDYGLTFDGETIRVSGGLASVSTTFAGLRPGQRLVGKPTGAGGTVRVEATAEPGP